MSKNTNPYANNQGGKIQAPHNVTANDPKANTKNGNDLRAKK